MNRADMERMLEAAPLLITLDSKQQSEVEAVVKMPGLMHLWGLMLGTRQTLYAAITDARLANAEAVSRASVLQGTIKGIELFHQTLIELSVPDGEQTEEQK